MEDVGAIVESLDPESVPRGTVRRVRLAVVEDGGGLPVALPILIARGKKDGPTLGVIAAIHGDEINGIPVIHRLFGRLDPAKLAGTVIGVLVVNYPAFNRQQRRYLDGVDLNHIMPGIDTGSGNASQTYAGRLMDRAIRRFDYLIDLHTASSGRHNTLYARADLDHPASAQLATLLRPQIILHNPPHDGTIRGEASDLGIPAVTLEIGNPQRFQPEFIRTSVAGLRAVMAHLEMAKARPRADAPEPIVCERSFWTYTDRGGLLTVHPQLGERVTAGAPLATLTNIFGDVTREYTVPEAGVIIGRAVNPVGYSGARIAHIGVERLAG